MITWWKSTGVWALHFRKKSNKLFRELFSIIRTFFSLIPLLGDAVERGQLLIVFFSDLAHCLLRLARRLKQREYCWMCMWRRLCKNSVICAFIPRFYHLRGGFIVEASFNTQSIYLDDPRLSPTQSQSTTMVVLQYGVCTNGVQIFATIGFVDICLLTTII